ncbi:hypothetical protein OR1_02791 [Geobacter sp. OR-1]|uniref:hypothetical protein n=1 Tax=Geobacter sp. OR-1 TaxID=1266765 RepID=UPI0005421645|nr:hypothetical protein [Geobacter sp. OR-1]GAM10502.1 hypothetical protein OR1_02791 [Geobacter sp. OR-1]
MKRFAMTLGIAWLILPVVPFIAAAGTGREDDGGFFLWFFIGLCALIVVLQLLPAITRLIGLARETKVAEPEPAPENREK